MLPAGVRRGLALSVGRQGRVGESTCRNDGGNQDVLARDLCEQVDNDLGIAHKFGPALVPAARVADEHGGIEHLGKAVDLALLAGAADVPGNHGLAPSIEVAMCVRAKDLRGD